MIKLSIIFLLSLGFTNEKLEKIIQSSSIKQGASILITKMGGESVLEWNKNTLRTPASLTKLAVAGAAYQNLPLDLKWQSQLLLQQSASGSDVDSLCFKAGGDPAFVSESMWVLANNFLRTGVKTIKKDLIVDESLFDSKIFDKGRGEARVSRAYDAPVSAASFNWNAVNIYVKPTRVGELATVQMDPENEYFQIINEVKTVKGAVNQLKHGMSLERLEVGEKGEKIRLRGSIGVENNEAVVYRSVVQPALWLGYNLKAFLKQRGIQINGDVKLGTCKSYSQMAAKVESKDLQLIIRDMMKYSNNFVTEMLVKHLSLKSADVGNIKDGKKVIQTYLSSIGVKDFKIESVSGLSYANKVSVMSLNKILNDLRAGFTRYEALETLPLAGLDGTLKSRMGKGVKVRAKTGLLSTAIGLAGYAEDKKNNLYSFVMIYNGKEIYKARDTFDKLLHELIK